jgi:hypothetical protein
LIDHDLLESTAVLEIGEVPVLRRVVIHHHLSITAPVPATVAPPPTVTDPFNHQEPGRGGKNEDPWRRGMRTGLVDRPICRGSDYDSTIDLTTAHGDRRREILG